MENLEELVFTRAASELVAYTDIQMDDSYTALERTSQLCRFLAAYQIIEEAGLEDEYEAWKEQVWAPKYYGG